jgi:hypothetical protein
MIFFLPLQRVGIFASIPQKTKQDVGYILHSTGNANLYDFRYFTVLYVSSYN